MPKDSIPPLSHLLDPITGSEIQPLQMRGTELCDAVVVMPRPYHCAAAVSMANEKFQLRQRLVTHTFFKFLLVVQKFTIDPGQKGNYIHRI